MDMQRIPEGSMPTDWLVRTEFEGLIEDLVPAGLTVEQARTLRSAAEREFLAVIVPTYDGDKILLGIYIAKRDLVLRSIHAR